MSITACRVRTSTTNEMQASRDAFGGGLMGEITVVAGRTAASLKVLLTHSDFGRIVGIEASGAFGAMS